MSLEYCAPCLFGLEGPLGNELRHMDMESVSAENGRVYFTGGEDAMARANIRSRFAERVLLVMGRCRADTFDALFEGVKAMPWEDCIPRNGAFPVKGWSLESALHSVPDCQKIVKKAVVERLKGVYKIEWFPEDGQAYPIQFSIMRDAAVLYHHRRPSPQAGLPSGPGGRAPSGDAGRRHGGHRPLPGQRGVLRSLLRQRYRGHRSRAGRAEQSSGPEQELPGGEMGAVPDGAVEQGAGSRPGGSRHSF